MKKKSNKSSIPSCGPFEENKGKKVWGNFRLRAFHGRVRILYLYRYKEKSKLSFIKTMEADRIKALQSVMDGENAHYTEVKQLYEKMLQQFFFLNGVRDGALIVCVPKLLRVGYNPLERLASDICDSEGYLERNILSEPKLLKRKKYVRTHEKGSRYRVKDVAETMEVTHYVKDKNVIILDDVISSGKTARACIKVLKDAGAKRVDFLAVYSTRLKKE